MSSARLNTVHSAQAQIHQYWPALPISHSTAAASGSPSTAATSSPLAASEMNSSGVMRLKPKRASSLNCRHSVKGSPSRPSSSATATSSNIWRRKSLLVSWPTHRSMTCRPPISVRQISRMAS